MKKYLATLLSVLMLAAMPLTAYATESLLIKSQVFFKENFKNLI